MRVHSKKRSGTVLLEDYLESMGGKVPFEMALHLLEPVLRKLAGMHEMGMCHLDICPEQISVDEKAQRALLLPPDKKDMNGYTILVRPGLFVPRTVQGKRGHRNPPPPPPPLDGRLRLGRRALPDGDREKATGRDGQDGRRYRTGPKH